MRSVGQLETTSPPAGVRRQPVLHIRKFGGGRALKFGNWRYFPTWKNLRRGREVELLLHETIKIFIPQAARSGLCPSVRIRPGRFRPGLQMAFERPRAMLELVADLVILQ